MTDLTDLSRRPRLTQAQMVHPCEVCGSTWAHYGYRPPQKPNAPARWYCLDHRDVGERWLRGEA